MGAPGEGSHADAGDGPARTFGPPLIHLEQVESTNDEVRRRLAAGARGPIAVFADLQTAGRGTRGRAWDSPAGGGLYFSWGQRASEASAAGATLGPVGAPVTPAAGIAAAEVLIEAFGVPVRLKPVNDLVVVDDAGRPAAKLGGILAESSVRRRGIVELVVGIGVNLLAGPRSVDPRALPATSVESLVGLRPDAVAVREVARAMAAQVGMRLDAALRPEASEHAELERAWQRLAVSGAAFPRP